LKMSPSSFISKLFSHRNPKELVFITATIISLLSVSFYFIWKQRPHAKIQQSSEIDKMKSDEIGEVNNASPSDNNDDVPDVEDVEDDDEDSSEDGENDDEEQQKIKDAELRSKYEDATRVANKLIQGNAYGRAIEKLTEALELAKLVPPSGKDVMALYNNRSAMYLKEGNVEKAMQDITSILTFDPKHIKARNRRAKIYEEQKKYQECLDDLMLAGVLQRAQNIQSDESKLEFLTRTIAMQRVPELVQQLVAAGESNSSKLPSRSHCKNFFDTFPSVHLWRHHFEDGQVTKSQLLTKLSELSQLAALAISPVTSPSPPIDTTTSSDTASSATTALSGGISISKDVLRATLLLICYELYCENAFGAAFSRLDDLQSKFDAVAAVEGFRAAAGKVNGADLQAVALMLELLGTQKHLLYDLNAATSLFALSLEADQLLHTQTLSQATFEADGEILGDDDQLIFHSVDVRLKQAAILLEKCEDDKAMEVFEDLLSGQSGNESDEFRPWVLIHRTTYWLNRNEMYELKPHAMEAALSDVEECLKMTSVEVDEEEDEEAEALRKAARLIALLRSMHVLTQTKQQLGMLPTEEDQARNSASLAEIKTLFPKHEAVLQLEVDALTSSGDPDGALQLLEDFARKHPQGKDGLLEVTLVLLRASIVTARAFMILQSPNVGQLQLADAQGSFKEAEMLYAAAMKADPSAIEVAAQFAQLKNAIGDYDDAVQLLQNALPISRSRVEVQELCQMLIMNSAQGRAYKEFFKITNMNE